MAPTQSANQGSLTKATLTILEPTTSPDPKPIGKVITFPFNPKDFTFTRKGTWGAEKAKDKVSTPEWKGAEPAAITVEMFLDASECEGDKRDITPIVKQLMTTVVPDGSAVSKNKPSAPHVRFAWGTAIVFKGYVESVVVKFTHFTPTGTPFRGSATVAMKEFPEDTPFTNPTSGGIVGHRSHRVVAGDTLASVAYREYGSAAAWRQVADANLANIDDPMRLAPGVVLLVPPH